MLEVSIKINVLGSGTAAPVGAVVVPEKSINPPVESKASAVKDEVFGPKGLSNWNPNTVLPDVKLWVFSRKSSSPSPASKLALNPAGVIRFWIVKGELVTPTVTTKRFEEELLVTL